MSPPYRFPTASPAEADIDPIWLEQAHASILASFPDATSLLVARSGSLISERYFGIGADEPQDTQSVTKSLLSLLTGVAAQRGLLKVDQPLLELWPLAADAVTDPRWQQVTVGHLLTMTSGLPSEITDPDYDAAWWLGADPVQFALSQTLQAEPGETFHYSNAGVHLLGALLAQLSGQALDDFAYEALLSPLGIPRRPWPTDQQGRVWGCGNLHLTPMEMLHLGQLVLWQGQWQEQSLVQPAWISEMTCLRVQGYAFMEGLPDYGWLWWLTGPAESSGFYAAGFGGQYIALFPALDLVVVMTGRIGHHPSHRHVISKLAAQVGHTLKQ